MKTFFFLLLYGNFLFLNAQNLIPQVFNPPVTGFELLRVQNPLILIQDSNSTTSSTWVNSSRFLRKPYSLITGFHIEDHNAKWRNGIWEDMQTILDSFILDNQNRLKTVIESNSINFNGNFYKRKDKYDYTYAVNNSLKTIDVQTANPVASNNFVNDWNMLIYYDQNGKRIIDSIFYNSFNSWYVIKYFYDSSGNDIYEIAMDGTDSSSISINTYNGNRVKSSYVQTYDVNTQLWSPRQADTFEYNTDQLVSKHIIYTLSSVNGSNWAFQPDYNETYQYSITKKLVGINSNVMDSAGTWIKGNKYSIFYDGNDNAYFGYIYRSANGIAWNNYPSSEITFSQFTGIKEIFSSNSFSVYPNPAIDYLNISNKNKCLKGSEIIICDLIGQNVLESKIINDENVYSILINQLKTGIYFLTIQTGEEIKRFKFIKN